MLGTVLRQRYKILSILGVGGFGQTYLAEDSHNPDHPKCVVKQFKPVVRDTRSIEIARRLFNTEVEVLRRLGEHEQIPDFFDFFEEDKEFYLVQEFIDGQSLADEFDERRLKEPEVISLLKDVLPVLMFVHQNRVIHRDIKPGNLIRRHADGKIFLIDFGAVKEINTQIVGEKGHSSFTVGIGTHGYTPPEQLAGKPRFCSDLYALGMTAIQAITGLQPSQLPEDPITSEYLWQDHADISLGLAFILDRMVRMHFSQRYQSAQEVLQSLERLAELPTDLTVIPPSLLLPESLLNQTNTRPPIPQQTWRDRLKQGSKVVAIATLAVSAVVLGVRQMGWLESAELGIYDRLVQLRPVPPPDPRLLLVEITEADLQQLNRPTPSDADVAQVIATLQQYDPAVIGLDLYRDLPQQPGQEVLLKELQAPNTVAILNLGSNATPQIPPPPTVDPERVGFNDFPIDPDGRVRRNLMFATVNNQTFHSFSMRVALRYLTARGITVGHSSMNPEYIEIGNTSFPYLQPNDGGYRNADTAGYQILLDYRAQQVTQTVAFTSVLNGQIDPELVRGRAVLIGTTAPSSRDLFITPFSTGRQQTFEMAGVVVHAQMVSQLISAALGERSLFWFWAEWLEVIWIVGWAIAGGVVVWFIRHPLLLVINGVTVFLVLAGASLFIFTQQGWIPIMAPAIATVLTMACVLSYRAYYMQREQQALTELWYSSEQQMPRLSSKK